VLPGEILEVLDPKALHIVQFRIRDSPANRFDPAPVQLVEIVVE
jgi:hypothetical protein